MQSVSGAFLAAVADRGRKTRNKLLVEWTRNATEPAVVSVSSSGPHSAAYLPDDDAANGLGESFPYAVCDQGCLANGVWFPFPEPAAAAYERGWWSDNVSEADKTFASHPYVDVVFASGAPWRKANIIRVVSSTYYDRIGKFKLWYKRSTDSAWQHGVEYTLTSAVKEVDLGEVLDLKAVNIEITESYVASDHARLIEVDAVWREDVTDMVERMEIRKRREHLEAAALPYGMYAASEMSVDLLEETGKFKGSGVYTPYLGPNIKLLPYIGVWTGAAWEYVAQGVFYTEDDWRLSEGMGLSVSARDWMRYHQEADVEEHLVSSVRTDRVFRHLAHRGHERHGNVDVEAFSGTHAWIHFEEASVFDAMGDLARAELATFYYDELGVLQVDNKDHFSGASAVATLTDSELFQADIEEPERANRVVYYYAQASLAPRQEVGVMSEEISVAAGSSEEITGSFDKVPVPLVSSPSLEAEDGISITDWWSNGIWWSVTVENSAGEAGKVTAITWRGRPLALSDEKRAVAQDTDLIRRQGKRPLEIDPTILSMDRATAQARAAEILDRLKSGSRRISLPMRSQPHWQLGDVVTVDSARAGIEADYFIQAIEPIDKSDMTLELIKL
ncbi:MAG: hypothetical protein SWK76_16980 [Actinomycetota bacterium]|nr:hypothetical protein [Actinomycetota bacterium]